MNTSGNTTRHLGKGQHTSDKNKKASREKKPIPKLIRF
jgi:hypothetical protein